MSTPTATFYSITNKSPETKTVDILVYGAIPSWEEDTYKMKNTADRFVQEFKALEKEYDRINIHINSPGGSVYHGFPIYNAIASSKKDIHTYNDGLAASMAGLLLLAGKTVHAAKNSILMIHNSNAFAIGHAEDMRDVATMLDTYDEAVAQHFADKSGKDLQVIKDTFLNYKDHFLTATKAMEEGFVDIIEEREAENAPPDNIMDMNFQEIYASYRPQAPDAHQERGMFQRFAAQIKDLFNLKENQTANPQQPTAKSQSPLSEAEGPTANSQQPRANSQPPTPTNQHPKPQSLTPNTHPSPTMDFKNSLALLGNPTLSAEDIAAIRAEITQFTGANEKFTAEEVTAKVTEATAPLASEITALKTEKANLHSQVTALTTEKETIANEVNGLKLDISAYRKSGVQIGQSAGQQNDHIPGEEPVDNFFSETDAQLKREREAAGLS